MSEKSMAAGEFASIELGADVSQIQNDKSRDAASNMMEDAKKAVMVSQKSKSSTKSTGAFRTISEVADELDVQQHVLRFWETKFTQVKPLKRGGGRRYYRPEDVMVIKKVHHLLYTEGYTIKGVQKLLKGRSKSQILNDIAYDASKEVVAEVTAPSNDVEIAAVASPVVSQTGLNAMQKDQLEDVLGDLKDLRGMVKPEAS